MALSDRGHPSVSSSGPAVPIVIKKKRREGCLRRAFPEAPPPLTRMKKNQKEEGDDTNSNFLPGLQILVPRTIGSAPPTLFHRKLRQTIPWIPFLVPRLRLQSRMPLDVRAWFLSGEDETAVLFPTDLGSHPSNRTSFSTSFKIHGGLHRIYP